MLDALHDSPIRTIVCRQEGGAAMMADCHGRLTGKPGICFVTRGPGATNASAGVHIAMQDSIPMILFIGQIAGHAREREAFQEVNYKRFFGDIAKWVVEIDRAERIPELVTRAFAVATSGRPGPVVISLPEDMLVSEVEAPLAQPFTPVETRPGEAELDQLEKLLAGAKRPFVILGGTRWTDDAVERMRQISEAWSLPVGVSFRRQMLFDHLHANYAGDVGIGINPKLASAIKEADLVLLIGGRMGEMPSSDYTILKSPYPDQTLVHVHADANELGRVYRPTLAINASPAAFVEAFAKRQPKAAPAWAPRPRSCTTPISPGRRRPRPAPARCRWARSWTISKACCRRMPSSPMAPVTMPPGCTASTASAATPRRQPRPPARWVTACPLRSRQRLCTPIAR